MARHAYWVILAGATPTAFRASTRDVLVPTLRQLQRTQPDVTLRWFERGRLWESPEAARFGLRAKPPGDRRGEDWRPGGNHRDPRARFEISRDERRARFKARARHHGPKPPFGHGGPDRKREDFTPRESGPPRTPPDKNPQSDGPSTAPPKPVSSKPFNPNRPRKPWSGHRPPSKPWQGGPGGPRARSNSNRPDHSNRSDRPPASGRSNDPNRSNWPKSSNRRDHRDRPKGPQAFDRPNRPNRRDRPNDRNRRKK